MDMDFRMLLSVTYIIPIIILFQMETSPCTQLSLSAPVRRSTPPLMHPEDLWKTGNPLPSYPPYKAIYKRRSVVCDTMPFPFALSRMIILSVIIIADVTSSVLCAVAFHDKTGGAFQILTTFFTLLNLLIIIGCLCHQFVRRDEEASNTRNLGMFTACWLFGVARAVALTFHARQDRALGLCNDFANVSNPCAFAGVELAMAYISPVFAMIGFIISWIDKFPGAVEVTDRYPITKAPSSQFAPHMHPLDDFTPPPVRVSHRQRKDSQWSDVPL